MRTPFQAKWPTAVLMPLSVPFHLLSGKPCSLYYLSHLKINSASLIKALKIGRTSIDKDLAKGSRQAARMNLLVFTICIYQTDLKYWDWRRSQTETLKKHPIVPILVGILVLSPKSSFLYGTRIENVGA
jgi:hypothetical protein